MDSQMFCKKLIRTASVATALSIAAAGGCAHKHRPDRTQQAQRARQSEVTDIDIVHAVRNSGVKAAILSQHTLFPYHFQTDGEALNELGERDLSVLASHLRAHPGQINIPRDGVEAAIYDARVRHVQDALRARGVDAEKVRIVDAAGVTAGSTPSEDILRDVRSANRPHMAESQSTAVPAPVAQPVNAAMGGQ
jgi:hypothetical protein